MSNGAETYELAQEMLYASGSMSDAQLQSDYGGRVAALSEDDACWLRVNIDAIGERDMIDFGLVERTKDVVENIYSDINTCTPASEQRLGQENAFQTFGPKN